MSVGRRRDWIDGIILKQTKNLKAGRRFRLIIRTRLSAKCIKIIIFSYCDQTLCCLAAAFFLKIKKTIKKISQRSKVLVSDLFKMFPSDQFLDVNFSNQS